MSMLVGCRVVRGPDWMWSDQDGGRGHLGTITELVVPDVDGELDSGPTAVKVTWDVGKKGNYRAGYEQNYDLRLYDNATTGVLHKNVRCVGCAADYIAGICWQCMACLNCNLCSECYMSDSHETAHEFLRICTPHDPGIVVGKRSESTSATAKGLLPGSKVSRGPDWSAEDKDGGRKSIGTVLDVCDWSECSRRSGVLVQWDGGEPLRYRVGHAGKVEVRAVEAAPGSEFYEEHLPVVGGNPRWTGGKKALVAMDTESIKMMQEDTEASWDNNLIRKIAVVGDVDMVDRRGWVKMVYDDGTTWTVPPFFLKEHATFQPGDQVRVGWNTNMIKELQPGHGGWSDNMKKSVGQYGRVIQVDSDGDVTAEFNGVKWSFHPAVLTLLDTDGKTDRQEIEHEDKSVDEIENIPTEAPRSPPKPKPQPIPVPASETTGDHREKVTRILEMLADKLGTSGLSELSAVGEKLIVRAASKGQTDKVKELLRQNPRLANATYGNRTPLQVAAHEGHLRVVQLLVEAHASLEAKDGDGDTALAYAVIGNNSSVAEYLLEQNAYANTTNKRRRTPLHVSAHKGHQTCAETLVKHGASVNMQDNEGNLPIHLAIKQSSDTAFDLLINHDSADHTLRNSNGFTPLHYAAKKGCAEAVKMIVARQPGLCNIQKDDGYTPLHLAVVNNHVEVTRILLQTSVCNLPTIERAGKATALHLATWQGHSEIIELLIEHGSNVNDQDKDGDTALHLATKRRRSGKKFVQDSQTFKKLCDELNDPVILTSRDALLAYLIRHGSDVTIKNHAGQTPIRLVKEAEVRRSLLKLAGVNPEDDEPMPPLEESMKKEVKLAENEIKDNQGKAAAEQPQPQKEPPTKTEPQPKSEARKKPKESQQDANGSFEGIHRINPDELDLGVTVGRGGFGEVKKAIWRGTTVAVKIIATAGSKESEVEKEVSIHKRARHPNIVSLMAVGHQIGQALIVMEFIDGRDLFDVIFRKKEGFELNPELKMSTAVSLLSALTFLHASKILHLDIKPSNIMVEHSSKRAYLCDLGLAHIKTRSSMSLSTSVRGPRGTITHMAPEMVQKGGEAWAGPGNDIWSMACTFLELFAEKKLWKGMEFMALFRTLLLPDTVPPILKEVAPEIQTVLEPCFRKDPLKRPTAAKLLDEFQVLEQSNR